MPELPEVETIKLGLQKYVVGHTISDVEVRLPRIVSGDTKNIIGAKIINVRRFGKGLVIDLDNGFSIAVHVKMTGQLVYDADQLSSHPYFKNKHTHIVLKLGGRHDAFLYYNDVRQFGWIKILPTKKISELQFFKNLGKEPLKDLTLGIFSEILKNSRVAIKSLLMDQSKIAGVGNIYANDALFIAKIHPKKQALSLSINEINNLFDSLEKVLKKGIVAGGASEWNYVDVLGGKGKYQNFFQVYQKAGNPCKNCGTIIQKINLGGRGTFYCPACQQF